MGSILSLEYEEEEPEVLITCPYFQHGCQESELTAKELERHLSDSALHHLKICENYIKENQNKEQTTSLHKHMQDKLDHVCYVSGCVDRMITSLEDVRDGQLELVKKVFMDSLKPFHEMSEHVKELEKFVHRVEYFVDMVHEHTLKFDRKAILELSMPRASDHTSYSHPLRTCKISVSDSVRFDRDRIYGHFLKMSKKISTLKSLHYNSVLIAKDVVEKLQEREDCDLETPFTEQGLMCMQTSFGIKSDSFLDVLNETYNSISLSYRRSLIEFITDPEKEHFYTDYYIWKVDAFKLRKDNVSRYYKKEHYGYDEICESDIENSFNIWATEDYTSNSGSSLTGMLVVDYTVQICKSDISAGIFCMNQTKLDRSAPSKVTITKMKIDEEENGAIFCIVAEFPFVDMEPGCLVDDTLYFNTVIA